MPDQRRPTGEVVIVKTNGANGDKAVTWKWLVGAIGAVGVIVVAGVIAIKTDIAGMKVDIQYIKSQMVLERGMAERHDGEIRQLQRDSDLLEVNVKAIDTKCKTHTHRRR